MKQLRLYVYPEDMQEILHVMILGDKSTQSDDIRLCKQTVEKLIQESEQGED